MKKAKATKPDFKKLLISAITEPGKLTDAYRAFHQYSIVNSLLALDQCLSRGIEVSPIASFNSWKEKGRIVKKGEKAIALWMPITLKKDEKDPITGEETKIQRTVFALKNLWFAYSQTDGEEVQRDPIPGWSAKQALNQLNVEQIPFSHINGNVQGFAVARKIAINPLAAFPEKTRFHELAHVVLGHTEKAEMTDSNTLPKNLMEVEAESVAYICASVLRCPGTESARAYVQGWLAGEEVDEKTSQRIFSAAQKILGAGRL